MTGSEARYSCQDWEWRIQGTECCIIAYRGEDCIVEIPSFFNNLPVTSIDSKAFLSCKTIQELTLPATIRSIGDWAFGHMKALKKLTLPAMEIQFGRDIFLDCGNLAQITLIGDTSDNPGTARLLAASVTLLQSRSLFLPQMAGCLAFHAQWLETFDKELLLFFLKPEDAGFEPIFYGWFNDEDAESSQRPAFIQKRRRDKASLAFLRLLYPVGLDSELAELLRSYLMDHMPMGRLAQEHTAVWEVLSGEFLHGNTQQKSIQALESELTLNYVKLLADMGYFTQNTLPQLLAMWPEAGAEVRGYLLGCLNERHVDFFEGFEL